MNQEGGLMNQERRGIDGSILLVKYSPDGTQIAVAGGGRGWDSSGFVHIYDARTLTKRYEQEHRFKITCLDWSPDSCYLACGGNEGVVTIWNPATDAVLSYADHSPEIAHLPPISRPQRREVYAVAWLPDARQVTSVGQDGCVRIWQAESGKTILTTYCEDVNDRFSYAPGGSIAAFPGTKAEMIASRYAHILMFNVQEERAMFSLLHEPSRTSCLVWAPQGIPHLAACLRGQIQIWDVRLARQLCVISYDIYQLADLYELPKHPIAWSPDGQWLACCVQWSWKAHSSLIPRSRGWQQAVIEVKSATTGITREAYAIDYDPYCLDFAPDGKHLVVGEAGGIEVLSLRV